MVCSADSLRNVELQLSLSQRSQEGSNCLKASFLAFSSSNLKALSISTSSQIGKVGVSGPVCVELTSSASYLRVIIESWDQTGAKTSTPLGYSSTAAWSPISANRGRGRGRVPDSGQIGDGDPWGSVPATGQIGDGRPVPVPGQIGDGDGDGDRGVRARPPGRWGEHVTCGATGAAVS